MNNQIEIEKCEICSETENLLICSRCKRVHYCSVNEISVEHQHQHWVFHKNFCVVTTKSNKTQDRVQRNGPQKNVNYIRNENLNTKKQFPTPKRKIAVRKKEMQTQKILEKPQKKKNQNEIRLKFKVIKKIIFGNAKSLKYLGRDIYFEISTKTPLKKLIKAYVQRERKCNCEFPKFYFDSGEIDFTKTPETYSMRDGCVVEAVEKHEFDCEQVDNYELKLNEFKKICRDLQKKYNDMQRSYSDLLIKMDKISAENKKLKKSKILKSNSAIIKQKNEINSLRNIIEERSKVEEEKEKEIDEKINSFQEKYNDLQKEFKETQTKYNYSQQIIRIKEDEIDEKEKVINELKKEKTKFEKDFIEATKKIEQNSDSFKNLFSEKVSELDEEKKKNELLNEEIISIKDSSSIFSSSVNYLGYMDMKKNDFENGLSSNMSIDELIKCKTNIKLKKEKLIDKENEIDERIMSFCKNGGGNEGNVCRICLKNTRLDVQQNTSHEHPNEQPNNQLFMRMDRTHLQKRNSHPFSQTFPVGNKEISMEMSRNPRQIDSINTRRKNRNLMDPKENSFVRIVQPKVKNEINDGLNVNFNPQNFGVKNKFSNNIWGSQI